MALVDDAFYVADTDAILRFQYRAGATRPSTPSSTAANTMAATASSIRPSIDRRIAVSPAQIASVSGTGLGEKELFYDEIVRVPFIVCDPDPRADATRRSR